MGSKSSGVRYIMSNRNWSIASPGSDQITQICNEYNLTRPIAMMLANRSLPLAEIKSFLQPKLADLSNPYEIPNMKLAVRRIWEAIRHQERILIFGDYDADGVTSCALLSWVLRRNGANVNTYLPHRLDDGYGLTVDTVEKVVDDHKLIVTVDCGITSVDAVDFAKSKSVDVIITDHHEPGDRIPAALATINPKLHQEMKKLHILAGVGVCFKLCHALIKFAREHNLGNCVLDLKEGLDLVALGTVADIVPLIGENRCMVKYGMGILSAQRRPGVRALVDIAGIKNGLGVNDISFRLAPRLNAAGRLGSPTDALNLLETDNIMDAYPIAETLEAYNRKRKQFEEKIFKTAKTQIRSMNLDEKYSLVIAEKGWHPGVIGIVASRLAQEFHRPTVILSITSNGEVLGSGRSVAGINLVAILNSCEKYLKRFGGHPMATGLILIEEDLPYFTEAFELAVRECCRNISNFVPVLEIDGNVFINELGDQFFSELETTGPFGFGNPSPVFRLTNVSAKRMTPVGKHHTRGLVTDWDGFELPFIAFGLRVNDLPDNPWDIVVTPQINRYNGSSSPQLQILDIKHAS